VLEESFLRWNSLFDEVRPSLLVADHSPRALLAVRGRPIRRVNVGTGFFCPPPGFPLPVWAPGNTPGEYSAIVRDEEIILQNVNGLLMSRYRRPLESLSDLFNDLDGVFLTTYPELDHFGPRPRIRYWGHWSLDEGEAPQWPQGDGPKVFAYLKPFPALPMLLRELAKRGGATIVVAPELGDETRREFASPNIQFERRPVDIRRVAHECDIAILNGNHGTTASMLRAGKACLLIPMFTEQAILANRVAALGAGCAASGVVPDEIVSGFDRMCTAGAFWDGADCFRSRHAQLGHDLPVAEIVNLISDVD
jgi:UDP:flavonoid glycosyltransferase YjiC (YdhE family)